MGASSSKKSQRKLIRYNSSYDIKIIFNCAHCNSNNYDTVVYMSKKPKEIPTTFGLILYQNYVPFELRCHNCKGKRYDAIIDTQKGKRLSRQKICETNRFNNVLNTISYEGISSTIKR